MHASARACARRSMSGRGVPTNGVYREAYTGRHIHLGIPTMVYPPWYTYPGYSWLFLLFRVIPGLGEREEKRLKEASRLLREKKRG